MKLLMENMEVVAKGKFSMLERRDLTKKGAYFMSCLMALLRGSKSFFVGTVGLQHHIGKGRDGKP